MADDHVNLRADQRIRVDPACQPDDSDGCSGLKQRTRHHQQHDEPWYTTRSGTTITMAASALPLGSDALAVTSASGRLNPAADTRRGPWDCTACPACVREAAEGSDARATTDPIFGSKRFKVTCLVWERGGMC